MMRTLRAVTTVAIVATAFVGGTGAFADPGNATHVDVVTAAVDASGIAVTGQATFVDVPGVVGEDPTLDAVPPGIGADLVTATISRPNPFADTLRFTLTIADQPPEAGGVPVVNYRWRIPITVGGREGFVMLDAWRMNLVPLERASVEPGFRMLMCGIRDIDDGGCSNNMLTGSMGDGTVAWNAPLGEDVEVGQIPVGTVITEITEKETFEISAKSTAFGHGVASVVDYDIMADYHAYTVPGPSVRMGIAPAGTPAQGIPLTTNGTVDATGAFHGSLPTPRNPGAYTIAARACHGANSCGIATTNVTVP